MKGKETCTAGCNL